MISLGVISPPALPTAQGGDISRAGTRTSGGGTCASGASRKALGEMLDTQIADFKAKDPKKTTTTRRTTTNGDAKNDDAKALQKDIKAFLTCIQLHQKLLWTYIPWMLHMGSCGVIFAHLFNTGYGTRARKPGSWLWSCQPLEFPTRRLELAKNMSTKNCWHWCPIFAKASCRQWWDPWKLTTSFSVVLLKRNSDWFKYGQCLLIHYTSTSFNPSPRIFPSRIESLLSLRMEDLSFAKKSVKDIYREKKKKDEIEVGCFW